MVVLAIGIKLNSSLSEINNLNQQVVELKALSQCQNEKRKIKEYEEEVKNLTKVKGRFLSMKEESNNSQSIVKYTDNLQDLLMIQQDLTAKTETKREECEKTIRNLETETRKAILKLAEISTDHEVLTTKFAKTSSIHVKKIHK